MIARLHVMCWFESSIMYYFQKREVNRLLAVPATSLDVDAVRLPELRRACSRPAESRYLIFNGGFWPFGISVVYLRPSMRCFQSALASRTSCGFSKRSIAVIASTFDA